MKELQQKEKELREMRQLGECFSLTYLGFYDNSFFWHSDIAPENPHKQAYWQYQGSDKRLISASRISLQQKENCSIRELESIESLNLLCSSIYNDLQYVGVGNAVTMEMIKEWPPVTNERKDALWKIEGRIFASSVTIMKEWSNLIKKLNTGMLVCKEEAQKLTFAENGRLEITVLLETLHVKGTIQSFFDPPEHHYDSKKGQWLTSTKSFV